MFDSSSMSSELSRSWISCIRQDGLMGIWIVEGLSRSPRRDIQTPLWGICALPNSPAQSVWMLAYSPINAAGTCKINGWGPSESHSQSRMHKNTNSLNDLVAGSPVGGGFRSCKSF